MNFFKKRKKESKEIKFLSILAPSLVDEIGHLPSIAICATYEGDLNRPINFIVNKAFIDFMHQTIGENAPGLQSMTIAASEQQNGYIYIIDFRTPEGIMGNVPPEDIIGAFKVVDGKIVPNSYQKNENYQVFTKNGLVTLPPALHEILIEEIRKFGNKR